ncbi:MAG: phosphoglycerate mutase family protein [Armatimonas sp.]
MKNLPAIVAGVAAGIALLCASSAYGIQPKQDGPALTGPSVAVAKEPTTIVIVRHAEKGTNDPRDPSLSEAGDARAKALVTALEGTEVSAIYSTQFRRTKETGEPLAEQRKLEITVRPVTSTNASTYAESLAREILEKQSGKTVVIIGHSNTVPELVKAFGGKVVTPLTEDDYDRLFLLVRPASGGPARLFQTRYGTPSVTRVTL